MKIFLTQVSAEEEIGSIQELGIKAGLFIGTHFLEIIIFAALLIISVFFFGQRRKRSAGI
ncbi:hypothetical protein [Salinimicrobium marinum]|uniref:hypothetical protein n=1 Tax=Salinimicrobium marinum TaxID=680283 RepID=UPI00167A5EC7|nr:hypothetical protein [Salinimicrobium marinum]